MKLVIELEAPAWVRAAAGAALTIACIGASGIALSVPKHFTSGETLLAADLEADFGDLEMRVSTLEGSKVIATAWQAYTPTVTAGGTSLTFATADASGGVAFWRRGGDTIEIRFDGSITNCASASGQVRWSLPAGVTIDTAHTSYTAGSGILVNNTTFQFQALYPASPGTYINTDLPPNGGGLTCASVPSQNIVRIFYSAPVVGWTVAM